METVKQVKSALDFLILCKREGMALIMDVNKVNGRFGCDGCDCNSSDC